MEYRGGMPVTAYRNLKTKISLLSNWYRSLLPLVLILSTFRTIHPLLISGSLWLRWPWRSMPRLASAGTCYLCSLDCVNRLSGMVLFVANLLISTSPLLNTRASTSSFSSMFFFSFFCNSSVINWKKTHIHLYQLCCCCFCSFSFEYKTSTRKWMSRYHLGENRFFYILQSITTGKKECWSSSRVVSLAY